MADDNVTQFPDLGSALTRDIIKAAIEVHKYFGPGLMENIYEAALSVELKKSGLAFEQQKPIPVIYNGADLGIGFRADFIIENKVIVELKAVEKIIPLHEAQLLSYMKLTQIELGLLINFNCPLLKDGVKRMALSQEKYF
jgi:GxxExxY protein